MRKSIFRSFLFLLIVFSLLTFPQAWAESPYTIKDTVIVDSPYAKVTVKGFDESGFLGPECKVLCENKSDKNLMFSIEKCVANGYVCDPLWVSDVPAGKKANSTWTFLKSDLSQNNISTIDELAFVLRVSDSDDWLVDPYIEEACVIYPTGKQMSEIVYPERREGKKEATIVSSDLCDFIILDTGTDEIWGYGVNCYIENKTDHNLMFSWDDVSVDGFMCDPFWVTSVPAHARAYSSVTFFDSTLEENDISADSIQSIEFTLRISDDDDWFADAYYTGTHTYEP